MSANWRALQRRHRWTYDSVKLPSSYLETLKSLPDSFPQYRFFDELKVVASLGSIHSQVTSFKKVVAAFSELLHNAQQREEIIRVASLLYLEILFQENSLPLHRSVLSAFSHSFPLEFQSLVKDCFRILCKEYGIAGQKYRRFAMANVATSILSLPKVSFLKEAVDDCAAAIAVSACLGLKSVLKEADEGGRPSPGLTEQCQEALSSLYYLLQQFPHRFSSENIDRNTVQSDQSSTRNESDVTEFVVRTILDVLQSSIFSRDCVVAAGVCFSTACQICASDSDTALFLTRSTFSQTSNKFCSPASDGGLIYAKTTSPMNQSGRNRMSIDFEAEFHRFTGFGKLCVLRGMLTATPRCVLNRILLLELSDEGIQKERTMWTLLFDGILPAICIVCENPTDSHFNFHAVTALQICMQQIKASFLDDLPGNAKREFLGAAQAYGVMDKAYDPFPFSMLNRLLKIIWNNWEDPLNQTVKQVQIVFELLLDLYFLLRRKRTSPDPIENSLGVEKKHDGGENAFLLSIAKELLAVGGHRKGRYVPLATLSQRLGARNLLTMNPNLLFETIEAYVDDDVCCAATSFLKTFLEHLREDCFSYAGGIQEGFRHFRRFWIPPVLSGLVSGSSKLRSNLSTYALPVALQVDDDGIFIMFAFVFNCESAEMKKRNGLLSYTEVDGATGFPETLTIGQRIAATISLLKVARSLALIEGDVDWCENPSGFSDSISESREKENEFAVFNLKGIELFMPLHWLKLALTNMDESMRVDAAEFLFLNPKTSSLVSTLELSLMRIAIPLNMRCSSTAFRMKWTSLFKKFFLRVRTAMERQIKQIKSKLFATNSKFHLRNEDVLGLLRDEKTQNIWHLLEPGVRELDRFMKWLGRILLFSLYPSAPYERKSMAMELLLVLIDIWPISNKVQESNLSALSQRGVYFPFEQTLLADFTYVIVGAVVDSWDKLRENAFQILIQFPTPMPGISSKAAVCEVITWAKSLASSPRVRESDAGALTLRLIFRKYVQELGWSVKIAQNHNASCIVTETCSHDSGLHVSHVQTPVGVYMNSLIDWLQEGIEEGEKDLLKACEHSFVHGVLLTLRYTVEELDWTSDAVVESSHEIHASFERLLTLVVRVTSLALWVVSSDAFNLTDQIENLAEELHPCPQAATVDEVKPDSTIENEKEETGLSGNVGPTDQVIMVGCWLAMKELSLLLGTITRKVPLPACCEGSLSSSFNDCQTEKLVINGRHISNSGCILDVQQLEIIGQHFLQVLLAMKHNGAIDKTRAGFTALCNRLLCSSDPRLNKMPEKWMKQLMQRTTAKGQTVDDLLRRSAGIPAAFIALFLAEPEGTPKKLLPSAMTWLIGIVNSFLSKSEATDGNVISGSSILDVDNEYYQLCLKPGFPSPFRSRSTNDTDKLRLKQRDEGVVPTVHAFNVLKVSFNDTNLSTDTSGFCSEALMAAIRAFASHHWEVRNSATLAYTALVHRMIGFLNQHKRESARRAMTGFEFFHRYPMLHPFLLEELHKATEQLEESSPQFQRNSRLGQSLHPSLCPVLMILSRFKPSGISRDTEEWLNPSAFIPFVQRCAMQCNLKVRVLASKALAPLVSVEDLLNTLLDLAGRLPMSCSEMAKGRQVSVLREKKAVSFNAVHGLLLQLNSLLMTNCMIISDGLQKDHIIEKLLPILQDCSWLGNIKQCSCPVVSSAYLTVLDGLRRLAGNYHSCAHVTTVKNMLAFLSSQCLDAQEVQQTKFFDSTVVDLLIQAASFYFNTFVQSGFSAWQNSTFSDTHLGVDDLKLFLQRVKTCMYHPAYEVRLVTLKILKVILESIKLGVDKKEPPAHLLYLYKWLKSDFQTMFLKRLEEETYPKCLAKLLQVFFLYNSLSFLNSNDDHLKGTFGSLDILVNVWNKLVSLKNTIRHGKTEEILMTCLGICIKHFRSIIKSKMLSDPIDHGNYDSEGFKSESYLTSLSCMSLWIGLIKTHSEPTETVNMRRATVEGMVASALLDDVEWVSFKISSDCNVDSVKQCSISSVEDTKFTYKDLVAFYGRAILDTWFTSIKLLEDEDAALRHRLSFALGHSMKCSLSENRTDIVPSQVERVLELCFEFLTSNFNHWIVYFDYLANWAFGSAGTSMFTAKNGDLVRRLFDKELDNHHEERLLVSQLCFFHLQNHLHYQVQKFTCNGGSIDGIINSNVEQTEESCNEAKRVDSFVCAWRMKFLNKIFSLVQTLSHVEGGFSWLGGISNHQDVFRFVYPCLLGLYALSFWPVLLENDSSKELSTKLIELTKCISHFLSNPLISNIYVLLLQAYKKQLGNDLDLLDLQNLNRQHWQEFNPYFLLG